MSVNPTLRKLSWEDLEFKTNLGYTLRCCLKKSNKTKNTEPLFQVCFLCVKNRNSFRLQVKSIIHRDGPVRH
jgi:hypothetical protein